jgi:hypothetical protein
MNSEIQLSSDEKATIERNKLQAQNRLKNTFQRLSVSGDVIVTFDDAFVLMQRNFEMCGDRFLGVQ